MGIEYLSSNRKYYLSYRSLQDEHARMVALTDEAFLKIIPDALHLACVICWLKEYGIACLEDTGIIHQLVHLLTCPDAEDLHAIRDQFKRVLELT